MLHTNGEVKRKWTVAVEWLQDELERVSAIILEPLLFIIHINDLPPSINTLANLLIFAGDTSVIISAKKFVDFCRISNIMLCHISKWFAACFKS
jgi:hypothetical protein